jgi:hypothetical protein
MQRVLKKSDGFEQSEAPVQLVPNAAGDMSSRHITKSIIEDHPSVKGASDTFNSELSAWRKEQKYHEHMVQNMKE